MFTETDCVSSVHQLVMALSPCRDCDNVTFSPLLIMSWPRPRLWSPQTSLAPGGGMLRALIGKKFGKQRRKMFVLRTSQYDIDSKDQLIVRWITSTFLVEMAIMSDEEEIKQSKLSCFRTSQLWSRQDEPGGDWTGQWRIFFANGSSDWVPWPAPAAEADTPSPQSVADPETELEIGRLADYINRNLNCSIIHEAMLFPQ